MPTDNNQRPLDPSISSKQDITTVAGGTVIGVQINNQLPPFPLPRLPLQKPPRAEHFTGRADELARLLADLQPGRRVTRCGPGGVGKTALAAEAVWTLAPGDDLPTRFPGGILFHTFYHQPEAAVALEKIARAYGKKPRPNAAEAARRALSGHQALLVLDGAEAAADLEAVLSVAPTCAVLITTRRHSDAPADWCDLAPLPHAEAVTLLQAWGGDYAADASAASRIAELVGRLPLALCLAGRYMAQGCQPAADYLAWLSSTPLAALHFAERESRSIPLLLDNSLAQVSETARSALAVAGLLALAPFARDLVAVALDIPALEADRALAELVNYGLLIRPALAPGSPGAGYQVSHALAHTYARQQLTPPATTLARLAAHYATLVREQSKLGPPGYRVLDVHRVHVLAVQSACAAAGQWDAVRKITWAASDYLNLQGHWTERVMLIQAGLAAARASGARYDEGAFLDLLGLASAALGKPRKAITHYEQALTISREIGDRRGEGKRLDNLGFAYAELGEPRRAIEFYEQALTISREIGDRRGEGKRLGNLGIAYAELGEPRRAIEFYEQALTISREVGDRRGEGKRLGNLGNAYADLGELQRAIEYHEQALAIHREIGDRRNEGRDLGNLGIRHKNLGAPQRAIEFYEQVLAISREIGDRRSEEKQLGNLGAAYAALGEPRRAIEFYERALAIAREIGYRRSEGTWLANLGEAHKKLGDLALARSLWQDAFRIREAIEDPRAAKIRAWLAALDQPPPAPTQ